MFEIFPRSIEGRGLSKPDEVDSSKPRYDDLDFDPHMDGDDAPLRASLPIPAVAWIHPSMPSFMKVHESAITTIQRAFRRKNMMAASKGRKSEGCNIETRGLEQYETEPSSPSSGNRLRGGIGATSPHGEAGELHTTTTCQMQPEAFVGLERREVVPVLNCRVEGKESGDQYVNIEKGIQTEPMGIDGPLKTLQDWEDATDAIRHASHRSARLNDLFSTLSAISIIFCNVVILAGQDLTLSDTVITVLVVLASIIKGTQLQFGFAAKKGEMYMVRGMAIRALADISEAKVLMERSIFSDYEEDRLRSAVHSVIGATPKELNWERRMKERMADERDTSLQIVGDTCVQDVPRKVVPEGHHQALPQEAGQLEELAQPANESLVVQSKFGESAAEKNVPPANDRAQVEVLEDYATSLKFLIARLRFYTSLYNYVSIIQTVMELALNSLIALSTNVEALDSNAFTSICAGLNAFFKGLQMKLELEEKYQNCVCS